MNERLLSLYEDFWPELVLNVNQLDIANTKLQPAHPLLIKVTDQYKEAKIKVMVVGQETDGWHKSFLGSQALPSELTELYHHYFVSTSKSKNNRPFWNRANFKYFQERLEKSLGKENIGFVWNNLAKIGKNSRGGVTKTIHELEDTVFNVHQQELKILKPDVVIFNTGCDRDNILRQRYGVTLSNTEYAKSCRELAQVSFSETSSDILSFRTFHPNARTHKKSRKVRNTFIAEQIINKYQ